MERIPVLPYGVARTRCLLAAGVTRRELRRLVDLGHLRRLQRGWYALPDAHRDVCTAIEHGGRLSCLSALALRGSWSPPRPGVHIRLLEHTRNRRAGVRPLPRRLHQCRAHGPRALVDFGPIDPIEIAVAAAGQCTSAEYFVAVLDSLLRQGDYSVEDLTHMLRHSPGHVRALVGRTDRSDAGTESLVRFRLRSAGIRVRSQVQIRGVGRVDLVVGSRLVLEVDSRAHHDDPRAYARDRERDLALARLGYDRLRLTYQHVMYRWDEAFAAILAIIRRGDHRHRQQR